MSMDSVVMTLISDIGDFLLVSVTGVLLSLMIFSKNYLLTCLFFSIIFLLFISLSSSLIFSSSHLLFALDAIALLSLVS
jgi:hypothetical protein